MAHEIAFYPVGNGDCCQVILDNQRRLLFDFCHREAGEDDGNPHIDLKKQLRDELDEAKRGDFDVVCFTHADDDHIAGSTEFFELLHAAKYQGKERVKILELWVPASMILEEGAEGEDRVLRQEARFRLEKGKGIKVFSKPEMLRDWMKKNGLDFESRRHLFVDAGQIVNTFSLQEDRLEVFSHSPFVEHAHNGDEVRNVGSVIVQLTLELGGVLTRFMQIGDAEYDVLGQIVSVTKAHKRPERLEWDLYNLPHHCSYTALGPEKGKSKTAVDPKVAELLRAGQRGGFMVSSSHPIPDKAASYDQVQPPHIQARKSYEEYAAAIQGALRVTMEYPDEDAPKPMRFVIDAKGVRIKAATAGGISSVFTTRVPRAG